MDSAQAAVQTDTNLSDGMCERYTAGFMFATPKQQQGFLIYIYLCLNVGMTRTDM